MDEKTNVTGTEQVNALGAEQTDTTDTTQTNAVESSTDGVLVKKKIPLLLIVIPVCVLAAVCIIVAISLFFFTNRTEEQGSHTVVVSSPFEYYAVVIDNTINALKRDVLSPPNTAAIRENPYNFKLNVSLQDYQLDIPEYEFTLETLRLITFVSNSNIDPLNKTINNDIGVFAGGMSIIDLGLYFEQDFIAITCPSLTNRTISVNPATFGEQWNEWDGVFALTSSLGVELPLISEDIDLSALNNFIFADKTIAGKSDIDAASLGDFIADALKTPDIELKEDGSFIEASYKMDALSAILSESGGLITGELESIIGSVSEPLDFAFDLSSLDFREFIPVFTSDQSAEINIENDLIRRIYLPLVELNMLEEPADVEILLGDPDIPINEQLLSDFIKITIKTSGETIIITSKPDLPQPAFSRNISIEIPERDTRAVYKHIWANQIDYELSLSLNSPEINAVFSFTGELTQEDDAVYLRYGNLYAELGENAIELKLDYSTSPAEPQVYDKTAATDLFEIPLLELLMIISRAGEFLYSF